MGNTITSGNSVSHTPTTTDLQKTGLAKQQELEAHSKDLTFLNSAPGQADLMDSFKGYVASHPGTADQGQMISQFANEQAAKMGADPSDVRSMLQLNIQNSGNNAAKNLSNSLVELSSAVDKKIGT